ncbi:MAG: ABC transporter ATP-binding protein [Halanaerobiaceae bacterium]
MALINSQNGGLSGFFKDKIKNYLQVQEPENVDQEKFISCHNLVKIYKIDNMEVFALQGLELNIKKGEMVGIIGSSGSGKSTLLNIFGGLDTPTGGQVKVAGWNINQMGYRDQILYKRQVVGFVWQSISRNLVPYLTALENVKLPMILGGSLRQKDWATELLEAVGLKDRMNHRPLEMSGGQQQRVAIAIALANKPSVLLADEPTGSLDSKTGTEIFRVLKNVSHKFGVTVIIVTHDRSLSGLVDRAVEIRDGKISTESVRQKEVSDEDIKIGIKQKEEDMETHNKYTIVDSAGRLQIPEDYLEKLGLGERAELKMEDERIVVKVPDDKD